MGKDGLSDKEAALIAAARREAAARGKPAPAAPVASTQRPEPAPTPRVPAPPAAEKPRLSPEERMAQLMAEERAETERRKKKMRRYGILIPSAIAALAALWMLRVSRRR